jgi:uncharacterized protein YjbJ (UPF0337 family)
MDWDCIQRNWNTMKGKIREKWRELTDEDLDFVAGQRDKLEGKIQERYGFASEHIKKEVDDWARWQPEKPSRRPAPSFLLNKKNGSKRTPRSGGASPARW